MELRDGAVRHYLGPQIYTPPWYALYRTCQVVRKIRLNRVTSKSPTWRALEWRICARIRSCPDTSLPMTVYRKPWGIESIMTNLRTSHS